MHTLQQGEETYRSIPVFVLLLRFSHSHKNTKIDLEGGGDSGILFAKREDQTGTSGQWRRGKAARRTTVKNRWTNLVLIRIFPIWVSRLKIISEVSEIGRCSRSQ